MSADSIGYPLPVIVNGFACLNAEEIKLAKKDVNPAEPHADPATREKPAVATIDPSRLESAKNEAAQRGSQVVSYAPGGVRTTPIDTGTVYQVEA